MSKKIFYLSTFVLFAVLLLSAVAPLASYKPTLIQQAPPADTYQMMGPFVDEILINIYFTPEAEWLALETGQIDVTDWPLPAEKVDAYAGPEWADKLYTYEYAEFGYFLIDLNHRRWPISSLDFRKALAHLTDKDKIVTDIVKGFGLPLTSVVLPAHGAWLNTELVDYAYDPGKAASILDAAGFTMGADGWRIDPKTGKTLRPLDFYIRADDPLRKSAGELIADAMESVGIPVNRHIVERTVCYEEVMVKYEFDMYTGGWIYMLEPDYLYDLYHSDMDVAPEPWGLNYGGFRGADEEVYAVKYSATYEDAVKACWAAQKKMLEQVANIPLWTTIGVKAVAAGWEGIVNELGIGINSWWTFLNAHKAGTTIRYGFKSDIESLNPVVAEWYWDWEVLGKIYDSLIVPDPFTRKDIGMLAESWTMEPWGENGTKITFNLREGVTWHDGTRFTSKDVKFTIDYFKETQTPRWLPYVADVDHVDTPDAYTVEVYSNITSYFMLHWVGWLPILPEHIWKPIGEDWAIVEPSTPEELVGTGPFKFAEYVPGEYVRLVKNTNYFLYGKTAEATVEAPTSLATGEVQTIKVTLPVPGATVTVKVSRAGVVVAEFVLKDVGNGVYEGPFIPVLLAPGDYDITVEASGVVTATHTRSVSITEPIDLLPIGVSVFAVLVAGGAIAYARRKPE